jgi:hypothetical protein
VLFHDERVQIRIVHVEPDAQHRGEQHRSALAAFRLVDRSPATIRRPKGLQWKKVAAHQIKAARALIGWHQFDLSAPSSRSIVTIRRLKLVRTGSLGGPMTHTAASIPP